MWGWANNSAPGITEKKTIVSILRLDTYDFTLLASEKVVGLVGSL